MGERKWAMDKKNKNRRRKDEIGLFPTMQHKRDESEESDDYVN